MLCWTWDITVWKSAWMTSAQLWSQRHHWPWADVIRADFQTVISRYLHNVNTRLFCTADRMFRTITMQNFRLIYACFPIKIRRGLNRPILRPLWLMTSAAADVISVPSVISAFKVKNILSMGKLKQIWSLKGIASRVFLESWKVNPVPELDQNIIMWPQFTQGDLMVIIIVLLIPQKMPTCSWCF